MRTARMIGTKQDGEEVILHPKSTCLTTQLAEWQKFAATGLPKGLVIVEFQTSDGPVRVLRADTLVTQQEADERLQAKQQNSEEWLKKQKENRANADKAEAAETQKRIDAANQKKEQAKKVIASANQPQIKTK